MMTSAGPTFSQNNNGLYEDSAINDTIDLILLAAVENEWDTVFLLLKSDSSTAANKDLYEILITHAQNRANRDTIETIEKHFKQIESPVGHPVKHARDEDDSDSEDYVEKLLFSSKKKKSNPVIEKPESFVVNTRLAGRTILFVGGGNLSFELSFAKKHPRLANDMVATTYEPIHALTEEAIINKDELESLGVKVYHNIDATRLHCLGFFKTMNPKHIYFSHPYSAEKGFSTSALIEDFFYSVSCSNVTDCKIHIIRIRGGDYEMNKPEREREFFKSKKDFDLIEYYEKLYGFYEISFSNFALTAKHRFNTERYPGYIHSKTADSTCSAPMVGGNNSLEYVFTQRNDSEESSEFNYFSEDIDSDSESDFEEGLASSSKSQMRHRR